MTEQLLNEYVRITFIIENIQNKLNLYKHDIENNIESSNNENEQNEKIKEFIETMKQIKEDADITQRYRKLKLRQKELKDILIQKTSSDTNIDIDTDIIISNLKSKYTKLSI